MPEQDWVFGVQSVSESLKSNQSVDRILIQREIAHREQFEEVLRRARSANIPISRVPLAKLNRVTRKNHQGIIAFISAIHFASLEAVLPGIYEKGEDPLILVLDRITDVRNFGAICRSAEALGVHAVIIPRKGGARVNADAMKTSSGALNHLPVCREDSLKESLQYLKSSGLSLVAASEKVDMALSDGNFKQPVAIVMGSEEDGVSSELLKLCEQKVRIPLKGQVESLNVSVATGLLLYETIRQRSI